MHKQESLKYKHYLQKRLLVFIISFTVAISLLFTIGFFVIQTNNINSMGMEITKIHTQFFQTWLQSRRIEIEELGETALMSDDGVLIAHSHITYSKENNEKYIQNISTSLINEITNNQNGIIELSNILSNVSRMPDNKMKELIDASKPISHTMISELKFKNSVVATISVEIGKIDLLILKLLKSFVKIYQQKTHFATKPNKLKTSINKE